MRNLWAMKANRTEKGFSAVNIFSIKSTEKYTVLGQLLFTQKDVYRKTPN